VAAEGGVDTQVFPPGTDRFIFDSFWQIEGRAGADLCTGSSGLLEDRPPL
jgi:hypothetical protein